MCHAAVATRLGMVSCPRWFLALKDQATISWSLRDMTGLGLWPGKRRDVQAFEVDFPQTERLLSPDSQGRFVVGSIPLGPSMLADHATEYLDNEYSR